MKKGLIYLAVVLVCLVLIVIVPKYKEVPIVIALAATAVYGYIYFNRKKDEEKSQSTEPEFKEDGENVNWESEVSSETAYQYLLHANYKLRVGSTRSSEEEVKEIESLIDDLRGLVLIMENSSSLLKWKINQICVDFIPKLIKRYNLASDANRVEIMNTTVADIRSKLTEMENAINSNNHQEFEHYANTLQTIMKA